MKIFILPVSSKLQPQQGKFVYPAHHKKDYGIEQDFLLYLERNPELVVSQPDTADWHYLPVYWTRYHWNHDHGRTGGEFLQQQASGQILDEEKTFTVCQDSDGTKVDLGKTVLFLASRRGESFDVPLLIYPHETPSPWPAKRWLASFMGKLRTHPIRSEMQRSLSKRDGTNIQDGVRDVSLFVEQILQSYIALCPRGYGPTSFRFYEAMQLGVVPLLISDVDNRPFKAFLPWDQISLYAELVEDIEDILNSCTVQELFRMGESAQVVWYQDLAFGKWCRYVLKELETLK